MNKNYLGKNRCDYVEQMPQKVFGLPGPKGVPGIQGPQGPTGPQGSTGPVGKSCRGPQGPTGASNVTLNGDELTVSYSDGNNMYLIDIISPFTTLITPTSTYSVTIDKYGRIYSII